MNDHGIPRSAFHPLAGEPNPFEPLPPGGGWRTAMPLDDFANERELADRVLARLNASFVIQREVRGVHCTGEEMRIDAVVRPRDPDQWKNPQVAFGIEFKYPAGTYNPGTRNYTAWAAQVIDYSHTEWDGYGRLFLFTCPPISLFFDKSEQDPFTAPWVISHLLGQLSIGELFLFWGYGLTFLLQGNHRVWSERDGVSVGRTWKLAPKSGSR